MDNISLTPHNRPKSAFYFEGWQEVPQPVLRQLLPFSSFIDTTDPSADSSPEAVIHSVPLQFQP